MPNLFWYVCLAAVSVGITAYAIYKKRDIYKASTLIVFFLFAAGITWVGEFIVLAFFNSYAYKPGLYANIWAENIVGHLILNTTLYPSVAIVMVAYSLRYGWISIVTAAFLLLEYMFIRYGLYEQHWWRYYMTAVAAISFLLIARYWFKKMHQKPYGFIRAATFYFAAMVIIHTPAPIMLLLGKQHYESALIKSLFPDFYLSSTVIIFHYHLIESFLLVLLTCVLKKWYWKIAAFFIPVVTQGIFAKTGVLVFAAGWNLIYTILIYEIFIAAFIVLEHFSLKNKTIYS